MPTAILESQGRFMSTIQSLLLEGTFRDLNGEDLQHAQLMLNPSQEKLIPWFFTDQSEPFRYAGKKPTHKVTADKITFTIPPGCIFYYEELYGEPSEYICSPTEEQRQYIQNILENFVSTLNRFGYSFTIEKVMKLQKHKSHCFLSYGINNILTIIQWIRLCERKGIPAYIIPILLDNNLTVGMGNNRLVNYIRIIQRSVVLPKLPQLSSNLGIPGNSTISDVVYAVIMILLDNLE